MTIHSLNAVKEQVHEGLLQLRFIAHHDAGPGVVISFAIAGLGCLFAGLCYSEYASMIPVAGSAYTYTYATLGRFVAWIIGWNLVLEYLAASSTVAVTRATSPKRKGETKRQSIRITGKSQPRASMST